MPSHAHTLRTTALGQISLHALTLISQIVVLVNCSQTWDFIDLGAFAKINQAMNSNKAHIGDRSNNQL